MNFSTASSKKSFSSSEISTLLSSSLDNPTQCAECTSFSEKLRLY
jgi:hypothetical protein